MYQFWKYVFAFICVILDDHVGYSRDISFRDMILEGTKGKGCDLVITSAKGDLKNVSGFNIIHFKFEFKLGTNP